MNLQAFMEEKARQNTFTAYNHIEFVSASDSGVEFSMEIRPESLNSYGMVHGGAIYAMADNSAGFAAHLDGRQYVTQTSSLHFLRNQSRGTVRALSTVRHRGNATCLVDVDILGDGGVLLATGEFTFFCVDAAIMKKRAEKE